MSKWIRPIDNSGTGTGVNDGSIYTFKERKYESLAREILQNSLDERMFGDLPVKVDFKLFRLPTADIPEVDKFKQMFQDGFDFWENNHQENGKNFFSNALKLLNSKNINVLRISDFNTKGVKGSQVYDIRTAADITPWYNLIKSEGSSSKGDTQGGSFGIGKNATFANSTFRTVFYSTSDEDEIDAHEGVAKLATVRKADVQFSPKAFYGEEHNGKSRAVAGLLDLDPEFKRKEYGTDIYVLGFEVDEDWNTRMVLSILSDFFLPIHNKQLEININGEIMNSESLGSIFDKYAEKLQGHGNARKRNELQNAFNYYQIITSEETQTFEKEFEGYGKAILKVLYDPEFDRQVVRTRETGMKLFSRGSISKSIGFSGIVSLEGNDLNKLFRKMENPAHTAWSPDNVDEYEDKKKCKNMLSELDKWIKDTIVENGYDSSMESQEVVGLGEYLPAIMSEPETKDTKKSETITNKIKDITEYKPTRKEILAKKSTSEEDLHGKEDEGGDPGKVNKSTTDASKSKGGSGTGQDGNMSSDGNTIGKRKVNKGDYNARLLRRDRNVLLVLQSNKYMQGVNIDIKVSGEASSEKIPIVGAEHKDSGMSYEVDGRTISIGEIPLNTKLPVIIELENYHDYALEVDLYEDKPQ